MSDRSWFKIKYACGHTVNTPVTGYSHGDRERYADSLAACLCPACREKKKEEEKALVRESNLIKTARSGYPDLAGTLRQIEWAKDIRSKAWKKGKEVRDYLAAFCDPDTVWKVLELHQKIMDDYFSHPEAKWYIENRDWFWSGSYSPFDECEYNTRLNELLETLKPEDFQPSHETNLEENTKAGLPALSGSEKEISQAEDIRAQIRRNQEAFLGSLLKDASPKDRKLLKDIHDKIIKEYLSHAEAGWFIQNKDFFGPDNNGPTEDCPDYPYRNALKKEIYPDHAHLAYVSLP